ncbi:hypothetical protein D1007_17206 [Hordeum vulgare]|nr:hypothetical protein D1007_17206 [Hordeum vulgare]
MGEKGGPRDPINPTVPQPALGQPTVVNSEGLEKVRLVVTVSFNEWGATTIWPGSWPRGEMTAPTIPLHIHALLARVLLPFSSFLIAVLSHFQIHALHLDPKYFVLLLSFVFVCEAFVGVTPSVELLRHFFSLELVSKQQCSGCVSLKAADTLAPGALDVVLLPEAKGFQQQWIVVEAAEAGALFRPPSTTKTPN